MAEKTDARRLQESLDEWDEAYRFVADPKRIGRALTREELKERLLERGKRQ